MLLIRAEQLVPQPWRNGFGRTRELLARPTRANWRLRVSLADIDADGPFSSFPGVQRWFAVAQGAGVTLRFLNGEHRALLGDEPLCFDGNAAPLCSLIDGPTRDINLMVREGIGAMRPVQTGKQWNEEFDERGLFTLCAGMLYQEPAGVSGNKPPAPGLRVEANTLLWHLGTDPCYFVTDHPDNCGWWLGYSANGR